MKAKKSKYLCARERLVSAMTLVGSAALAMPAFAAVPDFVETPVNAAPVAARNATATQQAALESSGDAEFMEQKVGDPAMGGAAPAIAAPPLSNPFGFLDNIQRSGAAFGDFWGARPLLARYGTTLTIQEQSELIGNATGGTGRAIDYEGLTTVTLQADTQRAFGVYGGLFNVSGLQIHGGNLSAQTLQTLQTASGIEADRGTRLWEAWYQQKFFDGQFDVRVGQQSLDQEFMATQNGNYFLNTMFGWAMLPSADLPGGGPAYPLSSAGLRARVHINDYVTLLTGLFDGSPVSTANGDPQRINATGTSFPVAHGALAIAELQFAYPGPNTLVQAGQPDPLARVYKLGFWYDSGKFADLRYDSAGQPLASPASTGTPQTHVGNYAFYAVADQMIYRWADDPDRNISVFLRPMFTPLQDRNLISFSLNSGLTMHEPFFGRDDDTFGLGMGYAHVSAHASGYDRDAAFNNPGVFVPVRGGETFVEATYQYQATAWLQIQPDAQYVFNPGAGIANPNSPNTKIHDEAVFVLRANMQL